MTEGREHTPVPRLRVFKDLDSDECFVAEWYPILSGGYALRIAEEGFHNEEHARDYIQSILYD